MMHACMEQTISCQAFVSYRYHGLSVWISELHAGVFKAFLLMEPTSATAEEINSHKGRKERLNSEERNKVLKEATVADIAGPACV